MKDIKVFLKNKTRQYGCERYKYLPENEEQKLVEYRRNYYKMRKNALLQLEETIILKSNYLENSLDEEETKVKYQDVLKNQF